MAKKKDLVDATATGDRLETLIALRDLLARRLQESGSDRDIASMSRRLMQCISEIETLEKVKDIKSNSKFDLKKLREELSQNRRMYNVGKIANEREGY